MGQMELPSRIRRRLDEQIVLQPLSSTSSAPPLTSTAHLWKYTSFLTWSLLAFVAYLVLPKGFRKAYCRANRRRFSRKIQPPFETAESASSGSSTANSSWKSNASPYHPGISHLPPAAILNRMMSRLEGNGLRLQAHGVHCAAKKVWIRYAVDSIHWQTEVTRLVTNTIGEPSKIPTKGASHALPLANVLYIDVGKRTSALMASPDLSPNVCLSLLTQQGSLDLECQSRLERDALVSCLSLLMDQVHNSDWRALYETVPPSETAPSSIPMSAIPSEAFDL